MPSTFLFPGKRPALAVNCCTGTAQLRDTAAPGAGLEAVNPARLTLIPGLSHHAWLSAITRGCVQQSRPSEGKGPLPSP